MVCYLEGVNWGCHCTIPILADKMAMAMWQLFGLARSSFRSLQTGAEKGMVISSAFRLTLTVRPGSRRA